MVTAIARRTLPRTPALLAGIYWRWETFPEYLDVVDALPKTGAPGLGRLDRHASAVVLDGQLHLLRPGAIQPDANLSLRRRSIGVLHRIGDQLRHDHAEGDGLVGVELQVGLADLVGEFVG